MCVLQGCASETVPQQRVHSVRLAVQLAPAVHGSRYFSGVLDDAAMQGCSVPLLQVHWHQAEGTDSTTLQQGGVLVENSSL
jgi:hypothetical protein